MSGILEDVIFAKEISASTLFGDVTDVTTLRASSEVSGATLSADDGFTGTHQISGGTLTVTNGIITDLTAN